MAQYKTCAEGLIHFNWLRRQDTNLRIGDGQLNKMFTTVTELTALGINGIKDIDWECISNNSTIVTGELIRLGVRDRAYVVDIELTTKGFNGVENTDWINIERVL